MNKLTEKYIDIIFDYVDYKHKLNCVDKYHNEIGLETDIYIANNIFSFTEEKLIYCLDLYFFQLLGIFDPNSDSVYEQGLVSYMLYGAAAPYVNNTPYNIKDKNQFKKYIEDYLKQAE